MESKENIYGILSFVLGLVAFLITVWNMLDSSFGFSQLGWLVFLIPFLGILFGAIQKDKGQTKLGKLGYAIGMILIFINLVYLFIPPF